MNFAIIILIQAFGIIIPILGITALLRKEQTKTSTYLMLANIGCLITNGCYLLLLTTNSVEAALLVYKIQYMGSGIFYFFFLMFIASYLKISFPTFIKYFYALILTLSLYFFWSGNFQKLAFEHLKFMQLVEHGFLSVQVKLGVINNIQYAITCSILSALMIYSLRRLILAKIKSDRHNLGRLIGAEFIILASIICMLFYKLPFDIIPLSASLSVFAIIVSVIQGDFFSIAEYGRDWIFDNIDNAFIIVDNAYGYIDSNAYARNLFPELKKLESREPICKEIRELFFLVEPVFELNDRLYEVRVTKLINEDELEGRCLILVDVTQKHQLLEELVIEKENAQEANRAKSRFMSNMSHEIRTPMNAIVGMSEVLMRSDLPPQEQGYLQNIKNSGEALLSIINDILDFSKIESGKLEIVEDYYEPSSMLSDLSMICLNRIGNKPIELIFDIDENMPQRLYGDALRLRQVMINFMNNAIKFTEKGYVSLSIKILSITENEVEFNVCVSDTGQGIKEEDLSKLFESFNQVDTKKNRNKEGTGLGLAISKQLVELMNGTVGVSSVYGEGSSFYFTIKQTIKNPSKACELKLDKKIEDVKVGSLLSNSLLKDQLIALCHKNHLHYTEYSLEDSPEVDYLFIDTETYALIKSTLDTLTQNTKIFLIQNPMDENIWDTRISVLNKPLYSISFANALNGEITAYESKSTNYMNFTAPQARILIVDDNEMNLKVAKSLLKPLNMHIETAENGKEAIALIESKKYDLVFMDHMMPIMDGIEATKELRSRENEYFQTLPIIALSANAIVEAKNTFKEVGMNDFVAKPIEVKQICKIIRKWLPKNYIIENTNAVEQSVEVEDIPDIKNLDVVEGIKNSGSKDLFINLLGDFYKLIDMKSQKIEKCLADGLFKDYTIEVHALKNTSRMIGAMELSQKFLQLEQYGHDGNESAMILETPAVLELYRSYKPILKEYGELQEEDKKEASVEEISKLLKLIQDATNEFDLDTVDDAMKKLEEIKMPAHCHESMEKLRAYVADVAMEEILELTNTMIETLRIAE